MIRPRRIQYEIGIMPNLNILIPSLNIHADEIDIGHTPMWKMHQTFVSIVFAQKMNSRGLHQHTCRQKQQRKAASESGSPQQLKTAAKRKQQ